MHLSSQVLISIKKLKRSIWTNYAHLILDSMIYVGNLSRFWWSLKKIIKKRQVLLIKIMLCLQYSWTTSDQILALISDIGNLIILKFCSNKIYKKVLVAKTEPKRWNDFFRKKLTWLVNVHKKINKVLNYLIRRINCVVTYELLLVSLYIFMLYFRNYFA